MQIEAVQCKRRHGLTNSVEEVTQLRRPPMVEPRYLPSRRQLGRLARRLTYILRHGADHLGMEIDDGGHVKANTLLYAVKY